MFEAGFTKGEGVFSPDTLIVGGTLRDRKVVFSGGNGVVPRGAVVGKVTATGEHLISAAAASDGSQVPTAIVVSDVDTTGGDAEGLVYVSGDFNAGALTYGAGHTAATVRDALRGGGIFLADVMA
ncbi:head decoration protein [Azospirillum sp. TSH64]|uniref:head decoration protein n=1 Tax=Azospirillum sp. TSH64 TaxID=652740 RepID=UPI000D615184|nr:head decoration protein [Azospirillum sp. TSH64]PWC81259.1 hypothetical protein TSH64_01035 [Azospirillum sp. TSH64]